MLNGGDDTMDAMPCHNCVHALFASRKQNHTSTGTNLAAHVMHPDNIQSGAAADRFAGCAYVPVCVQQLIIVRDCKDKSTR